MGDIKQNSAPRKIESSSQTSGFGAASIVSGSAVLKEAQFAPQPGRKAIRGPNGQITGFH